MNSHSRRTRRLALTLGTLLAIGLTLGACNDPARPKAIDGLIVPSATMVSIHPPDSSAGGSAVWTVTYRTTLSLNELTARFSAYLLPLKVGLEGPLAPDQASIGQAPGWNYSTDDGLVTIDVAPGGMDSLVTIVMPAGYVPGS